MVTLRESDFTREGLDLGIFETLCLMAGIPYSEGVEINVTEVEQNTHVG